MDTNVQERVLKVISDVLDRRQNEISIDCSLRNELQVDSLKQMTLFIALEDEFQRSIPPEAAEGLVTVRDVIEFVQRKILEPTPA